jgi:hypothetical protein
MKSLFGFLRFVLGFFLILSVLGNSAAVLTGTTNGAEVASLVVCLGLLYWIFKMEDRQKKTDERYTSPKSIDDEE